MERYPLFMVFEELVLLKCPYYPKQSKDLMQSLSKYLWHFFTDLKQIMLQLIWNHKISLNDKTILRIKNKAGDITVSDFWLYYKAAEIKTVVSLAPQTHWLMILNRETSNKATHLESINLWQRWQEYTIKKRQVVQGKLDSYM